MALKVDRVDTWLTTIKDQAGGLSAKLTKLADAGVNVDLLYVATGSRVVFGSDDLDGLKKALDGISL